MSVTFAKQTALFCHDNKAINNWRNNAYQAFELQGLPTRKVERWKYTDLSRLLPQGEYISPEKSRVAAPHTVLDALQVVMANGDLIALPQLPEGASIVSLAEYANEHPEGLLAHLQKAKIDFTSHSMAALNQALMSDGVVITLAKGTTLTQPILIDYVSQSPKLSANHYTNLVLLEEGAAVEIIERAHGLGSTSLVNSVTVVDLAPTAHCRHSVIGQGGEQTYHIAGVHVNQDKQSQFESQHLALSNQLLRVDVQVHLSGEGAECLLLGAYCLTATQHADFHTIVEHHASHTASYEYYKGIIDDKAHGVFNGQAIVHPAIKAVKAHQQNQNLLLSHQAEIDTKPELEIYADDVECTHGATVGQLDLEALFYLQSRGIELPEARAMLTSAFTTDVLHRVNNPALQAWLIGLMDAKMSQHFAQE